MPVRLVGIGHALPATCYSNQALIDQFGVASTDAWIQERTGITQRYFCADGESVLTLASGAAQAALAQAGIAPTQLDAIIVATCTPRHNFPSVALYVQQYIGAKPGLAYDVNAACSGFLYGLQQVQLLIASGTCQTVLLIGAEEFSRLLDWQDRTTCVLFGDGAGAVLFQATPNMPHTTPKHTAAMPGILGVRNSGDGRYGTALTTKAGGGIHMVGREVFKHAVRQMGTLDAAWLATCGITPTDITWAVPHQANARILHAAGELAGFAPAQVISTLGQHANTSAASIPLALSVMQADGRLQAGDVLYLQAFGAGFTWGEAVVRY